MLGASFMNVQPLDFLLLERRFIFLLFVQAISQSLDPLIPSIHIRLIPLEHRCVIPLLLPLTTPSHTISLSFFHIILKFYLVMFLLDLIATKVRGGSCTSNSSLR